MIRTDRLVAAAPTALLVTSTFESIGALASTHTDVEKRSLNPVNEEHRTTTGDSEKESDAKNKTNGYKSK